MYINIVLLLFSISQCKWNLYLVSKLRHIFPYLYSSLGFFFFHVPAMAILHIKDILLNMYCRKLVQKEYLKKTRIRELDICWHHYNLFMWNHLYSSVYIVCLQASNVLFIYVKKVASWIYWVAWDNVTASLCAMKMCLV